MSDFLLVPEAIRRFIPIREKKSNISAQYSFWNPYSVFVITHQNSSKNIVLLIDLVIIKKQIKDQA